jgi:hypothetical protein
MKTFQITKEILKSYEKMVKEQPLLIEFILNLGIRIHYHKFHSELNDLLWTVKIELKEDRNSRKILSQDDLLLIEEKTILINHIENFYKEASLLFPITRDIGKPLEERKVSNEEISEMINEHLMSLKTNELH